MSLIDSACVYSFERAIFDTKSFISVNVKKAAFPQSQKRISNWRTRTYLYIIINILHEEVKLIIKWRLKSNIESFSNPNDITVVNSLLWRTLRKERLLNCV